MDKREAWLAQGREEALEPGLPICDPHHHLWEYPGSRYLAGEFHCDLGSGHHVVSTVFVECLQMYREDGPAHLRPVGETEFVERETREPRQPDCRVAAGIVGFADLALGARVRETLEAHLEASPRFRGVRHASAWHASDRLRNAHTNPPEGLLSSPQFREGFGQLQDLGLSFDAWLYHTQVPELVDLARAFPGTTIILDHMAGPPGIGPFADDRQAVFRDWRVQMQDLAGCENTRVKLGGRSMTLAGFGWHREPAPPSSTQMAAAMRPYFEACIEAFGPRRCMFESNFPVDRASCTYGALWNAFKRVASGFDVQERAALLHDTATAVYRLEAP